MRAEYAVGDKAWIYVSGHSGELSEGEVVLKCRLPGYSFNHYIVEVPTHVDPLLEVRSALEMSDAADKPIGIWRRFKSFINNHQD